MTDALKYALLAQQSYIDTPTYGCAKGSARGVVYGDVLAFRGTDDAESLLADLDAINVPTPLGSVHAGFWRAWMTIAPSVLQSRPLEVICGHSEGAALALIAGAMMCKAGRWPHEIWCFAPPRVSADDVLEALFRDHGVQLHLYRHAKDVITDSPIWNRQPGPLIEIGSVRNPLPNIEDHPIERYIEALQTQ